MIMLALVSIILAGLMIGRMPEYLGRENRTARDEIHHPVCAREPAAILRFTALAGRQSGARRVGHKTQELHGFTETLYAYTLLCQQRAEFAGLNANTLFYNFTTAVAMM